MPRVKNVAFFLAIAVWLLTLSCSKWPEIEPCTPNDAKVYENLLGERVTEIELSNWAVLESPESEEPLEFWTGTFRIECMREVPDSRPWVRLIDDEKDKAAWTAP